MLESISCKSSADSYIVLGDLNVDLLSTSQSSSRLRILLQSFGLCNAVTEPTRVTSRTSTAVDVALSSPGVIANCTVLHTDITDHYALLVTTPNHAPVQAANVALRRNLRSIHWENFRRDLGQWYQRFRV